MPSKSASLYELTSEAIAINNLLEQIDGDISEPEIEDAITKIIEDNTGDLKRKFDSIIYLIAEFEARAEFIRKEVQRLTDLARVKENNAKRLKRLAKLYFERTGKHEFETDHFKLAVVPNGGVRQLILSENIEPEKLPRVFQKVVYEADKVAIRRALENGRELEFARLADRGTSLRIK